jgi:hypothetical protein
MVIASSAFTGLEDLEPGLIEKVRETAPRARRDDELTMLGSNGTMFSMDRFQVSNVKCAPRPSTSDPSSRVFCSIRRRLPTYFTAFGE